MNLVKRHFFTTIEKQKKIRSVTKCNDAGFLVEIAIFNQKIDLALAAGSIFLARLRADLNAVRMRGLPRQQPNVIVPLFYDRICQHRRTVPLCSAVYGLSREPSP